MEDQYQFILHHEVMEKQTDDPLAIPMVQRTKQRFPSLKITSFDKGFHSLDNQKFLNEVLDVVALPRKGRLSRQAQEIEASEEFRNARRKYSAVESAINALEVHGLDHCRDHGIYGFKRYIALAIVARNIHRIGSILKNREQQIARRKSKKYLNRNGPFKITA
jgi:IS5 family transposase